MHNIVASIICSEYDKNFKDTNREEPYRAMALKFRLSCDYAIEDGYRNLHILIFNTGNYVSVFAKLDWTVIKNEWLEDGDDAGIKPGFDYIKGATPWVHFSCHDSCWRTDGVQSILFEYRNRINMIESLGCWYSTELLSDEDIRRFHQITEDTRNGKLTHSRFMSDLDHKWS